MKEYKAYIFDLYGTLIDIRTDESEPKVWKKMKEWYNSHGADYTRKELRQCYLQEMENAAERVIRRHSAVRYPEPDLGRVLKDLFLAKGVKADEELIAETATVLRTASMHRLRLYAGAYAALRLLKDSGKKLYLLSNAQRLFTINELKKLGLADGLFNGMVLSSDAMAKKPDALIYEVFFEKYRFNPSDCLMIGNDLFCDIGGAKKAGMDTYYILTGLSPEEDRKRILSGEKVDADYVQNRTDWEITLHRLDDKIN